LSHFEGIPILEGGGSMNRADGSTNQDGCDTSELFRELVDEAVVEKKAVADEMPGGWVDEKRSVLIVDDDSAMRQYIVSIFCHQLTVFDAADGREGVRLALEHLPDIIISDIKMEGLNGIDLCRTLKSSPAASHIPIILLTGTLSSELELEGVEGGADDYITKPFDKELLLAKVSNLLQNRNNLRKSLFNEVTHTEVPRKVSADDKAFLDQCTAVVEKHLDEEEFTIRTLAMEMGLSHSSLYKKIKALSGQSLNGFIRLIRLRNAAVLCINSTYNVNEIAIRVGILDRTHFREQFQKVYGMTAAEYIRKYRRPFNSEYSVKKK
jgi:YesN/AraC family two-component response regulator